MAIKIKPWVFFKPNNKFIKWLTNYAKNRLIFEAGCGTDPYLLKKLTNKTPAIGCDPHYNYQHRTTGLQVIPMEINDCKPIIEKIQTKTNILFITARPNHSGWLTDIPKLMKPGDEWLYIGLKRNIENDEVNHHTPINFPKQTTADIILSYKT